MNEYDEAVLNFLNDIQTTIYDDYESGIIQAEALKNLNDFVDSFQAKYELLTKYYKQSQKSKGVNNEQQNT